MLQVAEINPASHETSLGSHTSHTHATYPEPIILPKIDPFL